jgi:hypothetical protein
MHVDPTEARRLRDHFEAVEAWRTADRREPPSPRPVDTFRDVSVSIDMFLHGPDYGNHPAVDYSKIITRLKGMIRHAPRFIGDMLDGRETPPHPDDLEWMHQRLREIQTRLMVGHEAASFEPPDALTTPPGRSHNGDREPAPAAPGSGPPPETSRPAVILGKPSDKPKVRGKEVPRLSGPRYNVVKALSDAWPGSLSKDELVRKSGHSDAVNILKRLHGNERTPDWASAIELAEDPGVGYRIADD